MGTKYASTMKKGKKTYEKEKNEKKKKKKKNLKKKADYHF